MLWRGIKHLAALNYPSTLFVPGIFLIKDPREKHAKILITPTMKNLKGDGMLIDKKGMVTATITG